jgi:hypothetical protein
MSNLISVSTDQFITTMQRTQIQLTTKEINAHHTNCDVKYSTIMYNLHSKLFFYMLLV